MIQIEGLVKSFGDRRVLDGVTLRVEAGEGYVLIGRSGCGKSVLLRLLLGLIRPDAGTIRVEGEETARLGPADKYRVRLKFGMLFQGAALFDSMNVHDNVAFALVEHTRMSAGEIGRRVAECLELVGLAGQERVMPAQLSGGMRKRVGIARAIALKPRILLFDEPTSGLDPVTADAANRLMIQLKERLKTTCVTVTHDMASACRIADRIGMLHEGRIHAEGRPQEIRSSKDSLVREFLEGAWGSSEISGERDRSRV